MPLYRFILHGQGITRGDETGGFYTTRWCFGRTQVEAAEKAIEIVLKDWTTGASAHLADGPPTSIEIDDGWPISIHQIWDAPNKGNTLYFGDDEEDDD
ncbi:MAG: hypothetical protein K0R83_2049 [Caulobacter sp.]|nr:hypothetical protein [Caulobacter sp.]